MSIPTTEAEIAAVFADKAKFSLGCMFAQIVVDTFFAGVMTMQVITYFRLSFKKDSMYTKAIVIFAVLINAAITVYLWVFIQYLFVDNFGLWSPFAETKWLAPFPFLDALNSGACQAFFTYRAWRLTGRHIIVPIVIGALILTSIGATLSVWIIFSRFDSLFLAAGVSIPENIWLASIMTADIIITTCILWGLWRSRTGWSHTDRTIGRLIRMTLESQVPPTFVAVTFMIEFSKEPSSLFGSTLQGIQPKLYAMGLMYALNQRVAMEDEKDETETNGNVYALSNRPTQKTIQVEVETDTFVQTETIVAPATGLNRGYSDDEKVRDLESLSDGPNEGHSVPYGSHVTLTR